MLTFFLSQAVNSYRKRLNLNGSTNGTLTFTTVPDKNRPEINDSKWVHHNPQISRSGDSQSGNQMSYSATPWISGRELATLVED